jgi:hypothetical protein
MHIIPKEEDDWRPSMNLHELIQSIPHFIAETLKNNKSEDQKKEAP